MKTYNTHKFLHCSYTIWHRLACPQPEQPELTQPPCIEGPLVLVHFTVDTQLTVTGSLVLDPLPYSRYQFLIEARNSIGAINSSLSSSIETLTSGKLAKFPLCIHICCIFSSRGKRGFGVYSQSNYWHCNTVLGVHVPSQRSSSALYSNAEWNCTPFQTSHFHCTF